MNLSRPLKLHLQTLRLREVALRVITLRPQTRVHFSTNYYHDTWHVLAGHDGARVFGRLMWGLGFHRQRDTVVLIDRPHLVPTPFDADPPDPILLVPSALTRVDETTLRELRRRLRRTSGPTTTIRWTTFGMREALDTYPPRHAIEPLLGLERMSRRAGFVCYTAPPAVLRARGASIHRMQGGESYLPLAEGRPCSYPSDGEFQLIPHFEDMLSAARVARGEVIPGRERFLASDDQRMAIWDHAYAALRRLKSARRRSLRAREGHDRVPGSQEACLD